MRPCDRNIRAVLKLSEEIIDHALKGVDEREDDECAILYGVMLDSAFKIKNTALAEKEKHIQKGWWV